MLSFHLSLRKSQEQHYYQQLRCIIIKDNWVGNWWFGHLIGIQSIIEGNFVKRRKTSTKVWKVGGFGLQRCLEVMVLHQHMHSKWGGGGHAKRALSEKGRGHVDLMEWEFDWCKLFLVETPSNIVEANTYLEEELLGVVELRHNSGLVVNTFWVMRILLVHMMMERKIFGEVVNNALRALRTDALRGVASIVNILDIAHVSFLRRA